MEVETEIYSNISKYFIEVPGEKTDITETLINKSDITIHKKESKKKTDLPKKLFGGALYDVYSRYLSYNF